MSKISQNGPTKEDLETSTFPSHSHIPISDPKLNQKSENKSSKNR